MNCFRKSYENSFTLTKSMFTSLSREDRTCEEDPDYDWGNCLDELFYIEKGKIQLKIQLRESST